MIYYLTVHWSSPEWIEVQSKFIKNNTSRKYSTFSFLNGFDTKEWLKYFDFSSSEDIKDHAVKLNILADLAVMDSKSSDDILIFIDGDAFPVESIEHICRSIEDGDYPLIAIQRLENAGDPQPHPSFCATTVGFWQKIHGDWKKGPKWRNNNAEEVTDVGARLWDALNKTNTKWLPLLRTSTHDLHPLWFGVYGDVVYHHGAGFRPPISRLDFIWLRKIAKFLPKKVREKLRDLFYSQIIDKKHTTHNKMQQVTIEDINSDFQFHRAIGFKNR